MKNLLKLFSLLFLITIMFAACSREEPNPTSPTPPPPPPTVHEPKMNEVYSRGDAVNPDWIEIYNPNTSQLDISGYKIYDNGGQSGTKPKKEFPAGSLIPAQGFLVIVVDDTTESGFGISSGGEDVWLESVSGTVVDNATIPALGVDSSYARIPDGGTTWMIVSPPTKGAANDTTAPVTVPVVMNEIYSRGTTDDPDWIEIYNPNSVAIDLSGYKIYDGGGNLGTKPKMEFPAGASVPANGYYVIVTDVSDAWGFGLSSAGEEVWLENANGVVIDNCVFLAMDVTQSWSRIPDGSANWVLSNTITKGSSNQP